VSPIDSATRLARVLADSADIARIVYSTTPATELSGAVAWLDATAATTRELVLVSDFQHGVIDSAHIMQLAARSGVTLVRVAGASPPTQRVISRTGDSVLVTDFVVESGATAARYRLDVTREPAASHVTIGDADSSDVRLLRAVAAREIVPLDSGSGAAYLPSESQASSASDGAASVLLYFGDGKSRNSARTNVAPLRDASQAAIVAALADDRRLQQVLADVEIGQRTSPRAADTLVTIARNSDGAVLLEAASHAASDTLVLFAHVPALSPAAAAILGAVERTLRPGIPATERDAAVMSDDELRQLEVVAAVTDTSIDDTDIGRWVWVLVLIALTGDWYMRRAIQAREQRLAGTEE
jgi:hypothetical protein